MNCIESDNGLKSDTNYFQYNLKSNTLVQNPSTLPSLLCPVLEYHFSGVKFDIIMEESLSFRCEAAAVIDTNSDPDLSGL